MESSFLNDYFYHNPSFKKKSQTNSAENTQNPVFKKISQYSNCSIEVDLNDGIALVKWVGKVDLSTTKKIIFAGINSEEFKNCSRILLDQSNLIEFSVEARVWLKHFLKSNARRFNQKILKLGSVKPKTASGLLFSNFTSDILKLEMPDLYRKRFENAHQAMKWLIS